MKTTIVKFGGSSFRDPCHYARVARYLAELRAEGGSKIVAVVSAMSGMTDELKSTVLGVNREATPSNLDATLAIGEMLSACLLEAAVSRLGIPVTSLNGYVLGIRTNSDFGRASVESVDPQPIRAALQEHDIVVVAGGQAVDESGRLTFLGRNSSDLTAVVIAAMLGGQVCEIYSDVKGVYTADPHLVPGARLIPKIGYGTIAQMSRQGAKVLHHRAVDYANKHAVTIVCKALTNNGAATGTVITGHEYSRSVTVARDTAVLAVASVAERDALCVFLDQHDISSICFEEDGRPCLCIITDIDFAMRLVETGGTRAVAIGSKVVVTELNGAMSRVHLHVNYESAMAHAQNIHEQMHPAAIGDLVIEND
ncbi:aspartate kinase [Rhizobium binae]|uniref:aspartate kinase n=1 Tax=Rhizobium binae TaxID=1138190 RepID=A0ABV2MRC0_9HYPH|nr:uridylate kinase [Rhizobium binae]NKL52131.1 uridylate kinase [Rhizobium leguminosarum bv. viciae]MBX4938849.1 uridylate kinase [Rhizobium binae]MBX4945285.1 uridylate kinase [Rhizobium binae]MBX4980838.1 uridylate kinase [Rhizobium binae]MBX4995754.1 uridylate kinase [Rhizobium binae]